MQYNETIYKSSQAFEAVEAHYSAMLESLKIKYEELNLNTRFGPTHLVVAGPVEAAPLVLIHGNGNDAMIWAKQIPVLAQKYRVYAIDVIGHNTKSAPTRPEEDSGYAEWLIEVLNILRIEKAYLVGHSRGGWIALKLATLAPERVIKLALLAPFGLINFSMLRILPLMLLTPFSIRRATLKMFAPYAEIEDATLDYFYTASTAFKSPPPPPVLTPGELAQVTMPVLVLAGDHDVLLNPEGLVQEAEKRLPGLQKADIIPAGHYMMLDQPETTTKRIMEFLKEKPAKFTISNNQIMSAK